MSFPLLSSLIPDHVPTFRLKQSRPEKIQLDFINQLS